MEIQGNVNTDPINKKMICKFQNVYNIQNDNKKVYDVDFLIQVFIFKLCFFFISFEATFCVIHELPLELNSFKYTNEICLIYP